MKIKFRLCNKCGERWNVSSIARSDKRYVCPICEHKARAEAMKRRRIRVERAAV